MVSLALVNNVEKGGLTGGNLGLVLNIGVQVQVAVLMVLLTYETLGDRAFGGEHVCYHLLGRGALWVREEETK